MEKLNLHVYLQNCHNPTKRVGLCLELKQKLSGGNSKPSPNSDVDVRSASSDPSVAIRVSQAHNCLAEIIPPPTVAVLVTFPQKKKKEVLVT
ncbi:hypothetical protein FF1_040061 [Malus domestica]